MKMKKIISAVIAFAMSATALASVASAAFEVEFDGEYYNVTDAGDVNGRTPKVTTVVTPLTGAEVAGLKSGVLSSYSSIKYNYSKGFSTNAGKYGDETAYKGYKIEGKVENVGELVNGWDMANTDENAWCTFAQLDASIDFGVTADKVAEMILVPAVDPLSGGTWQGGAFGSGTTVYAVQLAPANPYPGADTYNENPTFSFTIYAIIPVETGTLNASYSSADAAVMYEVSSIAIREELAGDGTSKRVNIKMAANSAPFTLGAPAVVPATGVEITGAPAEAVEIGYTATLGATVTPAEATDKTVTWSSNASDIVSVDAATGAIVAKAAGEAVITATCGTVTDTVTITVKAAPVVFSFTVGGVAGPALGTVVENPAGVVWANCVMKNITPANTYVAKFSADGYEDADRKTTLDLGEINGDVTFDAVMWFAGEAKTGVTMNVVEVAAE